MAKKASKKMAQASKRRPTLETRTKKKHKKTLDPIIKKTAAAPFGPEKQLLLNQGAALITAFNIKKMKAEANARRLRF